MAGYSRDERSYPMNGLHLFEEKIIKPFEQFGITHSFFSFNVETILSTWVILALLTFLLLVARYFIPRKNSVIGFMAISLVQNFIDMCSQNLGRFVHRHVLFIMSLFIFILLCNCAALIPFVEEPTKDLNTTLILGIISFLYVQYHAYRSHGAIAYIKDFFSPFFIMFPINIIGELATIISISFRLYGNIFGGFVISGIYNNALSGSPLLQAAGILSGINFIIMLFFGLFEGFIQAFVFSMLSLTYLSLATAPED